jgi:hypothetical protein
MNIKDRLAELLLTTVDRFLDALTFGMWTQICGNVVPDIKVLEVRESTLLQSLENVSPEDEFPY